MGIRKVVVFSLAASAMAACMTKRDSKLQSSGGQLFVSQPSSIEARSGSVRAKLTSTLQLDHLSYTTKDGYLLISWTSAEEGAAQLTFESAEKAAHTVTLALEAGSGGVMISPDLKLSKDGSVSGEEKYICGSQGKLCSSSIPVVSTESTLDCGVQGERCAQVGPGKVLANIVADGERNLLNKARRCGPESASCR